MGASHTEGVLAQPGFCLVNATITYLAGRPPFSLARKGNFFRFDILYYI
jgi:hypothetical protein